MNKRALWQAVGLTAVPVALLATACSGGSSGTSPRAPIASSGTTSATAVPSPSVPAQQQSAVPAESNPPGDIPDNLAFVPYANASGRYRFTHPEGWAEQVNGTHVLFTDKLNGVTVDVGSATAPPTVASARRDDVPKLRASEAAFELRSVTAVTVPGGSGVRIVYRRNSAPDPVTGRQYRDEVERYELVSNGREVVMELFGPVGADNVDAYRTMVQSLRLT
jgi:hypothetical protein